MSTTTINAFGTLPAGLRDPLLAEYQALIQGYLERKWSPASLSGGRFCEIVYSIIDGFGSGTYPVKPTKPANMVVACRALENRSNVPRSFQILIPRLLPALYEVRNNRGIGHVGGDVDPNHMDASVVLSIANWVMGELVRVLHSTTTENAQSIVDNLSTRRIPLVWEEAGMRRVLDPKLKLQDQILLLISAGPAASNLTDLFNWTGYKNRTYFTRQLKLMHDRRLIDISLDGQQARILPPGSAHVEQVVRQHQLKYAT